jgi:hypothetical protein
VAEIENSKQSKRFKISLMMVVLPLPEGAENKIALRLFMVITFGRCGEFLNDYISVVSGVQTIGQ